VSLHETYGRSLLEAVSAGTPAVLYADLVAPLERLQVPGALGISVVPRDPAALARAVARVAGWSADEWRRASREAAGSIQPANPEGCSLLDSLELARVACPASA
jgi:glycosyltransferase involved in cell wall biosynthesis